MDAVASIAYPEDGGWRSRGLGDSVNASNVSRKKLGDCDFQHPEDRVVIAFEAHAGVLSDVYFLAHLQSLRRVLPIRVEEWEGIADPNEWKAKIVFVAHDITVSPELAGPLHDPSGAIIEFEFLKFGEFVQADAAGLVDAFAHHVHAPMNERRTPDVVRERYLELYNG